MFQEQRKDDDAQMELQNQCYDDINRLTDEIKAAEKRINQIDEELNEKIPIRDNKISERTDLEEFKDLLIERMRQMLANKNTKEEQWTKIKADHDHAAQVIQTAKQIIENALRNKSFLEKSNSAFVELTNHFHDAKKTHFEKKSWNSYFKVLATISAAAPQANQDTVQRILGLCDRLLDEISKSREVERRAYDLWMQEYDRVRNNLQKRLDETQVSIDQLTAEINALTKRINMLQEEKVDQQERIEQKTKEREQRKTYCDDEAAAYAKRRQSRNDEMEVVSDAIALLTQKLRMLKRYVSNKTSSI